MPGVHKNNTISFRPSEWERIQIEERARLSGLCKKDFITRSCINSNICVVGSKDNIQKIIDSIEEMHITLKEISSSMSAGDFPLSRSSFDELEQRYYAMCRMVVEILDGAAYLFDKSKPDGHKKALLDEKINQLLKSLKYDMIQHNER